MHHGLGEYEFIEEEDYSQFNNGKVVLNEPIHISPRITAQKGLFSVHPDPTLEFKSKHLSKWIIPKENSVKVLIDLDSIGINAESLFPGLEVIAIKANEDVFGEP
jgi:hypothetical protein